MSSLYAVLLGGSGGPGRLSEDHETVFVVADDEKGARASARKKWSGYGKGHVDAIELLEFIDGHRISLSASEETTESFFFSYNDIPFDEEDDD